MLVNEVTAVSLLFPNVTASIGITFNQMLITPEFRSFNLGMVEVIASEVGTVNPKKIINGLGLYKDGIAAYCFSLKDGIKIPEQINGFFEIKQADFKIEDGYISAMIVPNFL